MFLFVMFFFFVAALFAGFCTMIYIILTALLVGFGALLCNHMGSLLSQLINLFFRFRSNGSVLFV